MLLSIGGATYSTNFASPVSTDSGRALFASSAISLVQNFGFDGLDINWEYPQDDSQAGNLTSLLRGVKEGLEQYGGSLDTKYHFELTFASPAGPTNYNNLQLSEMDQYLDFWNLMAYDYTGPWSEVTGHQANIFPAGNDSTPFNTRTAVEYFVSEGIAADKIVLGMPVYGRSFTQTMGLGQIFGGTGQGTWEKGIYDFKSLPLDGAEEIYDEAVEASYSWDIGKQEVISYDNIAVAQQKASWIQEIGLGGAMWWESSADKSGSESLVENVVKVFGDCIQQSANNLDYPDSPYTNIRNSSLLESTSTGSTTATPSISSRPSILAPVTAVSSTPIISVDLFSSTAATILPVSAPPNCESIQSSPISDTTPGIILESAVSSGPSSLKSASTSVCSESTTATSTTTASSSEHTLQPESTGNSVNPQADSAKLSGSLTSLPNTAQLVTSASCIEDIATWVIGSFSPSTSLLFTDGTTSTQVLVVWEAASTPPICSLSHSPPSVVIMTTIVTPTPLVTVTVTA